MNIDTFFRQERASNDTLDVKRIYIDMAEDLAAGVLLSQIIYWNLPDRYGKSKLRVFHEGHYWLAKRREDWWDECRLTPKQYDRAISILEDKKLVVTDTTMFAGKPSKVVRLDFDVFLGTYEALLDLDEPEGDRGEKRSLPLGNNDLPETVNSITETTSQNTTAINGLPVEKTTNVDRKELEELSYSQESKNSHRVWQGVGAMLSPFIAEELVELENDYTPEWVCEAIRIAARAGIVKLPYIKGVLKKARENGRMDFQEGNWSAPPSVPVVNPPVKWVTYDH